MFVFVKTVIKQNIFCWLVRRGLLERGNCENRAIGLDRGQDVVLNITSERCRAYVVRPEITANLLTIQLD